MNKIKIGGIIKNPRLSALRILGIEDRPGIAAAVMNALGEERVNVQFIVQCIDSLNRTHICLCVDQEDVRFARGIVEPAALAVGAESVVVAEEVSLVSIFGPDFRERPGISGRMFSALASRQINILGISTSISTISCVIETLHLEQALEALEETFDLP